MQEDKIVDKLFSTFNVNAFNYKYRLETFTGKWNFDKIEGAKCKSEQLAEAGFVCTATKVEPDSARCFICQHELLWDPEDDPFSEHEKHRPDCEFIRIKKPQERFNVADYLRLISYANSIQMHEAANETISNLKGLMDKVVTNTERFLG